jgi:protein-S-isoprenylcysteine O-methyltransferase Ste14
MGAVLFLSAGRLDWLDAWLFLTVYFLVAVAAQIWLMMTDPDLVEERWRWGANTKAWDKWIIFTNSALLFALLVVIGLDAGRFGWSHVPWLVRVAALLGFVPAFGLPLLASRANTYLASTVRIQEERGHTVVTAGPYAFIRHPMYAGMILYDVCVPLLLGSWVGLAISAVMITMAILRTALEDRTLQAELPGYREYASRVRFQLLPRVW